MSTKGEKTSYCIYSGKYLPNAALSKEHIVPKSLGGNKDLLIKVSSDLNSRIGTEVDAKVANDSLIVFGRMKVGARGRSKQEPVPTFNSATAWKRGDPWGEGKPNFRIKITNSEAQVFDLKKRESVPSSVFYDTGFVSYFTIDSVARLKFVVKVLLGFGWKLYGLEFERAFDAGALRNILFGAPYSPDNGAPLRGSYFDEFMDAPEEARRHLALIKAIMCREEKLTLLINEMPEWVEFAVSCFGYLVGVVHFALKSPIRGENNKFLFVFDKAGMSEQIKLNDDQLGAIFPEIRPLFNPAQS